MIERTPRSPQTLSKAWAVCAALGLCAPLVTACGGRSTSDGAASSSGASGSSSAGASGSSSAGTGGSSSAGANSAGASGTPAGGASAAGASGAPDQCAAVDCPNIVCPANTAAVIQPGACCPTCESTCEPACVPCPVNTHAVMKAGACCPSCESSLPPPPTCEGGEMTYAAQRAQMLDKYSHGCATDQDCVAMAPSNLCEPGCSYAALVGLEVDNFNSNLKSLANAQCVACPITAPPPCVAPPMPVCVGGACAIPVK